MHEKYSNSLEGRARLNGCEPLVFVLSAKNLSSPLDTLRQFKGLCCVFWGPGPGVTKVIRDAWIVLMAGRIESRLIAS